MCDRRCVIAIVHEAQLATTTLTKENQSRRQVSVGECFGATLLTAVAPFAVCYVVRAASPSLRLSLPWKQLINNRNCFFFFWPPKKKKKKKKIGDETAFCQPIKSYAGWPCFPSHRSAQKRATERKKEEGEELQEKRRKREAEGQRTHSARRTHHSSHKNTRTSHTT